MDNLAHKLQELTSLIKKFIPKSITPAPVPELPKLKQPVGPSMNPPAPKVAKMPGMSPKGKKDPRKVAEQIKNGHVRAQTMEMLKFNESGQWQIEKKDSE